MGGAVTGFTKTFKREKPECLVKVVDFEKTKKPEVYADLLIAETLSDNGVVEIGYKNDSRWAITLSEQSEPTPGKGMDLNKDTVFLVTGAAGSIVSAITADLAREEGKQPGDYFSDRDIVLPLERSISNASWIAAMEITIHSTRWLFGTERENLPSRRCTCF